MGESDLRSETSYRISLVKVYFMPYICPEQNSGFFYDQF